MSFEETLRIGKLVSNEGVTLIELKVRLSSSSLQQGDSNSKLGLRLSIPVILAGLAKSSAWISVGMVLG